MSRAPFVRLFYFFLLIILINQKALAFTTIGFGAFQGYQTIKQSEDIFLTTSTLASTPTIGVQFQLQQTIGSRYAFRLKYEKINVKFITPPNGFSLTAETFQTQNIITEYAFAHNLHWQSFIKIAWKERILYNLDINLAFHLYKAKLHEYGYGFAYDTQNLGGLVLGAGASISLLQFDSHNLNNVTEKNLGADFELRGKLGWIYEIGWGNILRVSYNTFYMPMDHQSNVGQELRFFGEFVKTF